MDFSTWDTCFNIFLLVFWTHIWCRDSREMAFNPYLAATQRISSGVLHFLRPAFLMLPDRLVAGIAMLLIMVLRAFAAPRLAGGWVLHMGFEWRQTSGLQLLAYFAFTVLSFAIFLFKIWGISFFFLHDASSAQRSQTHETLDGLCRPFVRIPNALRPPVLLLFGIGIAAALSRLGVPAPNPFLNGQILVGASSPSAVWFWRCAISAMSGWVEILAILLQAMLVFIVGSWLGLLVGTPGLSHACREWTDMLLGPLRRYPMRIGTLDLSPIVYILAVSAIQGVLQHYLTQAYVGLLHSV